MGRGVQMASSGVASSGAASPSTQSKQLFLLQTSQCKKLHIGLHLGWCFGPVHIPFFSVQTKCNVIKFFSASIFLSPTTTSIHSSSLLLLLHRLYLPLAPVTALIKHQRLATAKDRLISLNSSLY
ncbi:unnamed protein product [Vicia faba]|uniref:Uncharacterized protein n=1 Tax=Vicia faba TaxID=3906 RepID=A0AAV1AFT5_VICFA|nr:unnamed protein product [Vicia faba]